MKTSIMHLFAAILFPAAFLLPAQAGLVQFTATIDSAQQTTGSDSTATGNAVLIYDVADNTLDLTVTINGFTNTLNASHIHEGPPLIAGGVVTGLGDESFYTRDGNTLTATFVNLSYDGDPGTLLSGGAYLNFHTTPWPGGEIRGQLIPDPVKLTAIITPAQQTASPPVVSDAFGAAQATYDPATNEIDALIFIYNFTNTFTNSHIHEAPVGVSGGVVTGLGGAGSYIQIGNTYTQSFEDLVYGGDPVALLSGGAYLNFHSDVYGSGEIRGQLWASEGSAAARLINVSARARVGTGEDVSIAGVVVEGTEPLRVLATGRGPFLTLFGVVEALVDPVATVYDSSGRVLLMNDNVGDGPYAAMVSGLSFAPDANEAGVLLILPPGSYTNIVSGAGGTEGVALSEAFEVAW